MNKKNHNFVLVKHHIAYDRRMHGYRSILLGYWCFFWIFLTNFLEGKVSQNIRPCWFGRSIDFESIWDHYWSFDRLIIIRQVVLQACLMKIKIFRMAYMYLFGGQYICDFLNIPCIHHIENLIQICPNFVAWLNLDSTLQF